MSSLTERNMKDRKLGNNLTHLGKKKLCHFCRRYMNLYVGDNLRAPHSLVDRWMLIRPMWPIQFPTCSVLSSESETVVGEVDD